MSDPKQAKLPCSDVEMHEEKRLSNLDEMDWAIEDDSRISSEDSIDEDVDEPVGAHDAEFTHDSRWRSKDNRCLYADAGEESSDDEYKCEQYEWLRDEEMDKLAKERGRARVEELVRLEALEGKATPNENLIEEMESLWTADVGPPPVDAGFLYDSDSSTDGDCSMNSCVSAPDPSMAPQRYAHVGDCARLLPLSIRRIREFFDGRCGVTRALCHERARAGRDDVTIIPAEAQFAGAYTVEVVARPDEDQDLMTLIQFRTPDVGGLDQLAGLSTASDASSPSAATSGT